MKYLALVLLLGCPGDDPTTPAGTIAPTSTVTPGPCSYPTGAAEPMALDQVLSPYSWPEALHMDGVRTGPLDLAEVACDTDPNIDWSPHDVLVFVSIPAW